MRQSKTRTRALLFWSLVAAVLLALMVQPLDGVLFGTLDNGEALAQTGNPPKKTPKPPKDKDKKKTPTPQPGPVLPPGIPVVDPIPFPVPPGGIVPGPHPILVQIPGDHRPGAVSLIGLGEFCGGFATLVVPAASNLPKVVHIEQPVPLPAPLPAGFSPVTPCVIRVTVYEYDPATNSVSKLITQHAPPLLFVVIQPPATADLTRLVMLRFNAAASVYEPQPTSVRPDAGIEAKVSATSIFVLAIAEPGVALVPARPPVIPTGLPRTGDESSPLPLLFGVIIMSLVVAMSYWRWRAVRRAGQNISGTE